MDTRVILEGLAEDFEDRPLDVVVEADLQAHLFERFRADLRSEGKLQATFEDKPLKVPDDDDIAACKENYGEHFKDTAKSAKYPLSRVHTEVNVTPDESENEQIDLVVLNEELDEPITWNDGSNRFESSHLDIAIELKYIKNKNSFPRSDATKSTIREKGADGLKDDGHLDLSENSLCSDVKELNQLEETDAYLVIFSNYDYLYRGDIEDIDSDMNNRDEIFGIVGDAFEEWVQDKVDDHVDVLYVHPTDHDWLTDN